MRQMRSPMVVLALLSVSILIIVLAMAAPACAQQAPDNGSKGAGTLPVSFILDSVLEAHEQDIKEKIFEYKFEAASNDPAVQADLVKERSDELKDDTAFKKGILMALMARKDLISGEQLSLLAEEMSVSIEKLNGRSKKLEEHAAGLTMLNGHKAYTDSVEPLIDDVKDAKELALKASQAAKDKKNGR